MYAKLSNGKLFFLLVLAWPVHAATINSFTAACSDTATPGTTVTCPAGNNIVLAYSTTGGTSGSIDQGVGAVTLNSGTKTVQPFNLSAITYTLTLQPGSVTASVTVNLTDDYALMAAWPTTTRAYGFNSAIPCDPTAPFPDPAAHHGDYATCGSGLDTTKGVSGAGSLLFTVPGVSGESPSGDVTINLSADGSRTFGEGSEFYLQIREYMDSPYVHNHYLHGAGCKANLTMSSGSSGTFQAGDAVASTAVSGTVVSWNSGTYALVISSSGQRPWLAGYTVTGPHGSAVIASNNGGGLTPTDCPGNDYNTGMKQIMIDPADNRVPAPTTADLTPNCLGTHIVTANGTGREYGADYMGCTGFGNPGQYQELRANFFPNGASSPSLLLQSGQPCPYNVANGTPGQPAQPPCVLYTPGEWLTLQYHVKIGTWYLYSPSGYPAATFDVSAGKVTGVTITDPGHDWVPGTTIILGLPQFTANWSGSTVTMLIGANGQDCSAQGCTRSQWVGQELVYGGGNYVVQSVPDSRTLVLTTSVSGGTAQGASGYLRGGAGNIPWVDDAHTTSLSASATCPVNNYGQISTCYLDSGGSGYTNGTGFQVRWPTHAGGYYRRDSVIEKWQARAGQPSLLLTTLPYYDLINARDYPQDWPGNGCGSGSCDAGTPPVAAHPPFPFGKAWMTPYMTLRDPNAGPYADAHIWYDNMLVGTRRFADPGVPVQPATNLAIDKTHLNDGSKQVALTWEANPDSSGTQQATGFDVERCAGQMYDCLAGNALAGTSWTIVAANHAGTSYTNTVPSASQVYTFRVRAVIGSSCSASITASCSEWSSPVVTAPKPPTDASAKWTPTGVQVRWVQRDEDPNQKFAVERCTGVFQYKTPYGNNATIEGIPYCRDTGSNLYSPPPGNSALTFGERVNNLPASTVGATLTWTDTSAVPGTLYSYRVRSYNAGGSWRETEAGDGTWKAYSANVIPQAEGSCYINQQSLPNATAGQFYSRQLSTTGCAVGQSWGGWTSCHGLSLNNSTGVLSGTPDAAATCGPYMVSYDTASQALSVTINAAPSGATRVLAGGRTIQSGKH